MANYSALVAAIRAVIKENHREEITGPILQGSLLSMVSSLGSGYQFIGLAAPADDPGTPDERANYQLTVVAAQEAGIESVPFKGVTLTTDQAIACLKAVDIYAMQCVGVTEAHAAAINALTSIEAVDAYDFTVGYPEKLSF